MVVMIVCLSLHAGYFQKENSNEKLCNIFISLEVL